MRIFFYIILVIGMLLVLYLSWVSSPSIGKIAFMPYWVSSWVDSYRFGAIRTGVPLVALGALAGLYINFEKKSILWCYSGWVLLTLLIVLAEVGQCFRPMRSFDIQDIFYGSSGAALGLLIIFFLKELKNFFKKSIIHKIKRVVLNLNGK